MPNYCSNSVLFFGDEEKVKQVHDIFNEIESKQKKTGLYHLPDFVTETQGYLQDTVINRPYINYETRWVPNLEVLEQIADHYKISFACQYREPMSGLYGEALYHNGVLDWANVNTYDEKPDTNGALMKLRTQQLALIGSDLSIGR